MFNVFALLTAAALAFLIGAVHSVLGEIRVLRPLLAPERRQGLLAKQETLRRVLRVSWHLVTLAWWGIAAIIAAIAVTPADAHGTMVLIIVSLLFSVMGVVALVASRGRHLSWIVFFAIAGLSIATIL